MLNYKPSVLAYAVMLRTQAQFDYRVLTNEMRDEFLSLQSTLNMDPSHVQEAMFAVENSIQVPDFEEYEVIKRNMRSSGATAADTFPQEDVNVSISPVGVAGV